MWHAGPPLCASISLVIVQWQISTDTLVGMQSPLQHAFPLSVPSCDTSTKPIFYVLSWLSLQVAPQNQSQDHHIDCLAPEDWWLLDTMWFMGSRTLRERMWIQAISRATHGQDSGASWLRFFTWHQSFSTLNHWPVGWINPCCGEGLPVHCGMVSSTPGLYTLISSEKLKMSADVAKCPQGAKSPLVENPCFITLFLTSIFFKRKYF